MKTYFRATEVFADAKNCILADCKGIAAEHAAKGLLGSGATAKRAVAAFDIRSKEALRQVLGEVANRIDHRGCKWSHEMAELERALEEHIKSAPDVLANSFRLAGLKNQSGQEAAAELINTSAQELRKVLIAFREGWTSPRSRPWRERNAGWYALLLILAGAIVSQIVPLVFKQMSDDANQTARTANSSSR